MSSTIMGYEKFGAYQIALEFYAFAITTIESMPNGNCVIIEQFRRAALSIVLNIAEGSGKANGKDRHRFYRIAIGSAMECGALLDVCCRVKLISETEKVEGKNQLRHAVGILVSVVNRKG